MLEGLSSKVKRRLLIAVTLWSCLWLVGLSVGFYLYLQIDQPGPNQNDLEIEIPPGSSVSSIGLLLEQQGAIKSAQLFRLVCWLTVGDRTLKAGTFRIPPHASVNEIILILYRGVELLFPVTTPEGLTVNEVIDVIVKAGFGTNNGFVELLNDPSLTRTLGIEPHGYEGRLFPDTYYFRKRVLPQEIIATMVRRFHEVFNSVWLTRSATDDLDRNQILTLASLIEKESSLAVERPLISRVFRNRIRHNILLQCDPTVIYALSNFNGNLTKADLKIDSPYNTYRYRGLPPGPICNPGLDSITAAIHPADGEWLYFVARGDGSHEFNVTLEDHNRAVYRYQIRVNGNRTR